MSFKIYSFCNNNIEWTRSKSRTFPQSYRKNHVRRVKWLLNNQNHGLISYVQQSTTKTILVLSAIDFEESVPQQRWSYVINNNIIKEYTNQTISCKKAISQLFQDNEWELRVWTMPINSQKLAEAGNKSNLFKVI